jgi:hypothetical protein
MSSRPFGREPAVLLRFPEPSRHVLYRRAALGALLGAAALLMLLALTSSAPWDQRASGRGGRMGAYAYVGHGYKPAPSVEHAVTEGDLRRALAAAVDWLVRHQFPEGCWDPARFYVGCAGAPCCGGGRSHHETGITALAVLALLHSGSCDFASGREREDPLTRSARRGLDYLLRRQDAEGAIGDPAGGKFLYGHAIATQAFCEGYRWSGDARYRAAARKALDVLDVSRAPTGGWRYAILGMDADTSVTGWADAACRAAGHIGLPADPEVARSALRWIESVTDPLDFRVGYTRRGTAGALLPGVNDTYAANETCTAIGITVRRFAGEPAGTAAVREGIRRLARDLPRWEPGRVDYYYWYHGTRALAAVEPPAGACRTAWGTAVARALAAHQDLSGASPVYSCARGSWTPADKWGAEGGRVYATALNALTLRALIGTSD